MRKSVSIEIDLTKMSKEKNQEKISTEQNNSAVKIILEGPDSQKSD